MSTPHSELSQSHPVIAGYRVGPFMGQGPLGKIYRATHQSTGETVIMRGFTRPGNADANRWQAAKDQFRQLLTVHQRVADLPGAPATLQRIIAFGEEQGLFWVASEYFEARPLRQILEDEGAQSFQWSLSVLKQVGEAVDWAARHGLAHTDLTPANVLVVQDPRLPIHSIRVEVINFGLAHARRKYGSRFAAPEQMTGVEGDSRSDIYAVGALLYEMLSGKPIFSGSPEEIAYQTQYAIPEPLTQLPVAVRNVLSKLLAKDPKQRYARLLEAIDDLAAGRSPGAATTATMPTLSTISPHLGAVGHADDSGTRAALNMERLPELPRGTAYVPLEPNTRVRLQDFDVSGQDLVDIYCRR